MGKALSAQKKNAARNRAAFFLFSFASGDAGSQI